MAKKNRKQEPARNMLGTIIAAVVVVVVIGAIAGYAIFRQQVEPFETVVLRVDDTSVRMRYFLKRLKLAERNLSSFGGATRLLSQLATEEVIRQTAPKAPYNIKVSEEDYQAFLRKVASRGGEPINDTEFEEWYRQQLNVSQMDDDEFRDMMMTAALREGLTEYLAERAPTVAEQVHIHMIAKQNIEELTEIYQRLVEGEDFLALAATENISVNARETQGDIGWHPRSNLNPMMAQAAFNLEVGSHSQPLRLSEQMAAIIMVTEKAAARELTEDAREMQKLTLVDTWAAKEYQYHKITFHGFNNGWDSETDAWARWQLMRMNPRDDEEQ